MIPTDTRSFTPIRNNPVASTATGVALIGAALTAIGILALLGVIPGVGSIAAICMIAGGGTLATIGALGMLKGLLLTNTRLISFASTLCFLGLKAKARSEDHSTTSLDVESTTEEALLPNWQAALPLFGSIAQKLSNAKADGISYATVPIANKGVIYCIYDKSSDTPFSWYRETPQTDHIYTITKTDSSKPWMLQNYSMQTDRLQTTEAFKKKFDGDDYTHITLDLSALTAEEASESEEISESEQEIPSIDFTQNAHTVKGIEKLVETMNLAEAQLKGEKQKFVLIKCTPEVGEPLVVIGIKNETFFPPTWYKYENSLEVAYPLIRSPEQTKWEICFHIDFEESSQKTSKEFNALLDGHTQLILTS